MLAFEDARRRLLAGAHLLGTERVALAQAAGRVLASDLVAGGPLPAFDHSAMDGYAVRTSDLAGAGPWTLPVAGESAAGGSGPPALAPAAACRIYTGAPVPSGADAVIMQEDVARVGATVRVEAPAKPGQHIRRAGEDLRADAVAIGAGTRLSPGALALAAMLDRAELVVARRPRVVLVCTGDELRAPGEQGRPASIPESNSAALAALARQAGAAVAVAPICRDDPRATQAAIEEGLAAADVLLTVGGVSVGDRDVVRPALERAGVALDFWRVAIRPGKPLAVGSTARARVLGLPGNPASALVTFALFGAPLLRALQGDAHPLPLLLPARLSGPRKRSPDRLELVRATLAGDRQALVARAHDNQSSGAATSLATSDGLAFVEPGEAPLPDGAPVDFVRWSEV